MAENLSTVWARVAGFPKYAVSDDGRVLSFYGRAPRLLRQKTNRYGYRTVSLYHEGKCVTATVHRLVGLAFIGNPDGLSDINHIDGVKSNNCVENLEWVSRSENLRHAYETGITRTYGQFNGRSKLTPDDVREIRRMRKRGTKQSVIADRFGIDESHVSKVALGRVWGHI